MLFKCVKQLILIADSNCIRIKSYENGSSVLNADSVAPDLRSILSANTLYGKRIPLANQRTVQRSAQTLLMRYICLKQHFLHMTQRRVSILGRLFELNVHPLNKGTRTLFNTGQ